MTEAGVRVEVSLSTEDTIEQAYQKFLAFPSDIQAHLPKLRELAAEVRHVTEFGSRQCFSTLAFLAARPKVLVSWDIDLDAVNAAMALKRLRADAPPEGRWATRLEPRCGNTLEILCEETDLLFIDTLHTFEQLRAELKRHGNKARKYLVFHDTWTYGYKGEDASEPGLRAAIRWFQEQDAPRWQLVHDSHECNGLIVLQRHVPFSVFSLGW